MPTEPLGRENTRLAVVPKEPHRRHQLGQAEGYTLVIWKGLGNNDGRQVALWILATDYDAIGGSKLRESPGQGQRLRKGCPCFDHIATRIAHLSEEENRITINFVHKYGHLRWLFVVLCEAGANLSLQLLSREPCDLQVTQKWQRNLAIRPYSHYPCESLIFPDHDLEYVLWSNEIILCDRLHL
jgi:hypothetical protein